MKEATGGATLALIALLALGCATVDEIERQDNEQLEQDSGFQSPGAAEGQRQLDSDLCWQKAQSTGSTGQEALEAHDECMAEHGWLQDQAR